MKIHIYIFVILILSNFLSYSQTFFDYSLDKNLVSQDGVVEVNLYFDIPKQFQDQFLIRPVLDNGLMYIYNPKVQSWINSNDLWSNMPDLSEKVKVKVASTSFEKVSLKFVIKNTYTQKEFETLAKPIWGKKIYKNYIGTINNAVSVPRETTENYTNVKDAIGESQELLWPASILSAFVLTVAGTIGVFVFKRKTVSIFK